MTSVESPPRGWIGRPLPRTAEDVRFTTGTGRYVDDLHARDALHAVFVRSPYAHARVREIRTDAARAAPGVHAVLTAADLAGRATPFPLMSVESAHVAGVPHPLLAGDRVRYVGEAIAVVVAERAELAADAAELVELDLEELPAIVDPWTGGPFLHDEADGNVLLRWSHTEGDVEGAFDRAATVVHQRIRVPRLVAAPLEPRAALASHDPATDVLTIWVSAQDPHRQLNGLTKSLRRSPEQLRIVVPDVGGAFGSKGVPAPETAVVAVCALELGRPVKWVETRTESSLATYQGRGLDLDVELAIDADGRFVALRGGILADLGAYLYPSTPVPPITAAKLLTGCYAIPAAHVEVMGVATTKVPTGPYRGAGRPEAALAIERLVDLAAAETGIDRVELRRRNVIPREAFPYRTPLGFTYDSGDYEGALDAALELGRYDEACAERDAGRPVGAGVALYVERVGPGWESAAVRVGPDGRVVCRIGSTSHGQGHATTFAQLAAETLGVDPDAVEVRAGDSAEIPEGVGTFASRSVTVGGSALLLALEQVRDRWSELRRSTGNEALMLAEAAALEPLEASARFELPGPVFSSGAYVAVVELEAETGEVSLHRLAAVDDCGRVVNPLLAEGQVVGATVQAIGECFHEQVGYDEDGQPLAVNLYDYHLPLATSVPPIASELRETPSPLNPLGAKGVGEGGSIGAPAAIANAVADALAPFGVRHLDPPFTPARVWEALRTAAKE